MAPQSTISRRRFVQTTAVSSLALAGMGRGRATWAQSTKPNIDLLAVEGLKFTQGYANSASCSPTRTALITGRYQYRLSVGIEEPINLTTPKDIGLAPSHPTLPSLLKQAGYATALVGKWHLGPPPDFSPLKSGYDHFFGIHTGQADYFNH